MGLFLDSVSDSIDLTILPPIAHHVDYSLVFFNFYFGLKMSLFCFHILKNIFVGDRIVCLQVFSFSTLKLSFHFFLVLQFGHKIILFIGHKMIYLFGQNFSIAALKVMCFHSLDAFKICYLALVFSNLTIKCLTQLPLYLFCLGFNKHLESVR